MTIVEADQELSAFKRLALMGADDPAKREEFIARHAAKAEVHPDVFLSMIARDWRWLARPKQLAPPGQWLFWLILAGRGFGKTLTGAEWSKEKALSRPVRFALVAPTLADVRETMVEGETGLLSILPDSALRGGSRDTAWNRGPCELYLSNGTYLRGFSAVEPDRLRGPQHDYAWGDEVSSWKDAGLGDKLETTFSNLKLGVRLGEKPEVCLTSTPKANKLTKELVALAKDGTVALTKGSSYENRDNLSEVWWNTVVAPYEGTRLGAQEIHAQVLEDVEGALWSLGQIDALRVREAPSLARIVVAVDPNASSDEAANSAGIVVVGRTNAENPLDRRGYVLADRTVTRGGPRAWAREAVKAYHDFDADRIVAEKNNGGEMVEITIHTVDPNVPVKLVSASRGKRTRAEPIASLYEGDEAHPARVHHVGAFPELEEEQTTWTPEAESPDRMDALVWGLSELLLGPARTLKTSLPKGRIPGVDVRAPLPTGRGGTLR